MGCCGQCRHFVDDPADFERDLPGILGLSSGGGDSKGDQGLCAVHQRMAAATMQCDRFERRPATRSNEPLATNP